MGAKGCCAARHDEGGSQEAREAQGCECEGTTLPSNPIGARVLKPRRSPSTAPAFSALFVRNDRLSRTETVLIVLREYPPFDALCRVPGKSDDDCEQPAQESVKKCYEEIETLFNIYDARVKATRLAKPKGGVRVLLLKEIKLRVERAFPRNVKKYLKVPTERPPQNVDALKRLRLPQNTLYVSKKSAVIALVDF